jgi:hypothetical protein
VDQGSISLHPDRATPLRIALSIIWLALAAVFFTLGWQLATEAKRSLPTFEATQPRFELSGGGFRFELDVERTPLETPFREFREQVNDYLTELGESVQKAHRRAAWGCFVAGAASLASLVVVWLKPASP